MPPSRPPVTTLVISDLHLGARLGRDVLRRPEALEPLLAALDGVERLVLLGDIVELLEGRPREAMDVAEPVLRALGARLGSAARGHRRARATTTPRSCARGCGSATRSLGVGRPDPARRDARARPLDLVAGARARARAATRASGSRDRVWATHGHYLDRHLLPEAAYGVARGLLGRLPRDGATPADYEGGPVGDAPRGAADPLAAAPAGRAHRRDGRAAARRHDAEQPAARCSAGGIAPFAQRALGAQMRRASIPALARVVAPARGATRTGCVFGHVHRCGPLAGDVARQWSGPAGVPRIANTGSWVYEPVLLHRVAPPHPYWPGGAIRLAEGGEPEAIGLLDHLDARLHGCHGACQPRARARPCRSRRARRSACSASRGVARAGSARRRSGGRSPRRSARSSSAPISRLTSGLPIT